MAIVLVGTSPVYRRSSPPYEVAGEAVGTSARITPIWFVGVALLLGMLFIGNANTEDAKPAREALLRAMAI